MYNTDLPLKSVAIIFVSLLTKAKSRILLEYCVTRDLSTSWPVEKFLYLYNPVSVLTNSSSLLELRLIAVKCVNNFKIS